MYWAIVGPEFVLAWAFRQYLGARGIYIKYKDLYPGWTMNHAHFLQMGGFYFRHGDDAYILDPRNFENLILDKWITFPTITKEDIQDRSKADGLSKIIVSSQALWFVIQCIGRRAEGLALAQLEVTTLAVISCTFLLSIIWWHKPLDAKFPVYLESIKKSSEQPRILGIQFTQSDRISRLDIEDGLTEATGAEVLPVPNHKLYGFLKTIFTPICFLGHSLYSILRTVIGEVTSHEVWKNGYLSGISKVFVGWTVTDPISAFLGDNSGRSATTRIPSYFALTTYDSPHESGILLSLVLTSTALFGIIHCIAWHFDFPLATEKLLWRISAVDAGVIPSLSAGMYFLGKLGHKLLGYWHINDRPDFLVLLAFIILFGCIPIAYVMFRLYLFIESLLSFDALPPSAFQDIAWSDFIPHL